MATDGKQARRFAILSTPRSGSNWLCGILDNHPQLRCHNELFNPARPFFAGPPPAGLPEPAMRERASLDWLERVMQATELQAAEAEAIGFKLHLDHRPSVLRHVLMTVDIPLIMLDRCDRLAQYASAKLSQMTGRYTARDRSSIALRPVEFELADFQEFVVREEGLRTMVRTLLDHRGQRARLFELDYEDIGGAETHESLWRFLGVDPGVPISTPRHEIVPTAARFADFEQVRAALAHTVHLRRAD